MEACRLTREKVDTQNAKLLELEQAMAKKESQESLLQEVCTYIRFVAMDPMTHFVTNK